MSFEALAFSCLAPLPKAFDSEAEDRAAIVKEQF
jgi:hypothetical protein